MTPSIRQNIHRLVRTSTALLALAATTANAQTLIDPDLTVQTAVSGLQQPTSIVFLGPEDFLVAEKSTGQVKRIKGGVIQSVLDLPVNSAGYRGLLGIELHPQFATNGWAYVFYSRADADGGAWLENRISRFTWTGAAFTASSERAIVTFAADPNQNNGVICSGGVMRFGPDGKLYGSTGDMTRGDFDNGRLEQNTSDTAVAGVGGLYRLNEDGSVPADNPFARQADPAVRRLIAYGVRDSFGITFDRNGALWMTENGPEVYDEINLVRPGFNSGWLKIMGPDKRNAAFLRNQFTAYDEPALVKLPGSHYDDPKFSFLQPIGITSLIWIESPLFPATLRGKLLVGDTNFGHLYAFSPNASRQDFALGGALSDAVADTPAERDQVVIGSGWGITTDLKLGPDGYLYQVSISHGVVRRIKPRHPLGDLSGDGRLDTGDIMAFNVALSMPALHRLLYPGVDPRTTGDVNGDGAFNTRDAAAFYDLLLRYGQQAERRPARAM
ncbi:MAG: PQQ-dependent sugar dehydrogenase [Phycisphaerae bacterium]